MMMDRAIYERAVLLKKTALKSGATFSTAESLTGGMIGACITAIPGSSDYFLGGIISYAASVKNSVLGVSQEIIDTVGVVSGECAKAMAEGSRRLTGARYAIAVTGVAGPDGGSEENPVGSVWFGLAGPDGTQTQKCLFPGSRAEVRCRTVLFALDLLLKAARQ